jgi:superfamily II DNA or RNA helicase
VDRVDDLSPGLYERLVTEELRAQLELLSPSRVDREDLSDNGDAHRVLVRHLSQLADRALRSVRGEDAAAVGRQVELANRIATAIADLVPGATGAADLVAGSRDVLQAISAVGVEPGPSRFPPRPETPLSTSALLVNGRDQPRIGIEVQRELGSADHVDLLCAFVKWHGLRVIDEHIEGLLRRGGALRVITTTYMGATESRALDRLVELGAQVKVSYETRMTRLHAKAWLFHRRTGYSTAYIGSSNLSRAALLDGLEWNVRLSTIEQDHLLDTFRATFDQYWEDAAFESYDPTDAAQRARLDEALVAERGGPTDLPIAISTLEVRPWGYQREILDELTVEREVHGSWRNLVVMATGTGKTVVAGLDYRRLRAAGEADTLLFVAHREEILSQSLSVFRHILGLGSFGERFVAGDRPEEWRHVFASVQSLARFDLERNLPPGHFDMVIVDEFHHASEATKTYATLLHHLRPKVLLGLTATPERADGLDVRTWFDGRTAVELRLWEALERGLLAPFQYFGIHDETDLRGVRWRRGTGYEVAQLTDVYTGHDARVRIVLRALVDKITDVGRMRALGFCVSIDHAEFMAARFTAAGIRARAVTSRTPAPDRRAALLDLRNGDVNILFTVDLYNEGIDVPEIDTVLFLRPTESATVFLQQLGRGLRLADNKPCLTVLDFIGNQAAQFRFDLRYRALTGVSRRGLAREVERGFPTLPPGCHIELDRVASGLVIRNVLSSLRIDWKELVAELRQLGDVDLATFVAETGVEVDDIYRRQHGGWAGLRRLAGLDARSPGPDDDKLARAIGRMLHVDDRERLSFLADLLDHPAPPVVAPDGERRQRLLAMLHFSLWGWNEPLERQDEAYRRLWAHPARREELLQLVPVLRDGLRRVSRPLAPFGDVPLHVHARYSLPELLAAIGVRNPASSRGSGVRWIEEAQADVFWFNLRKSEKHFSPTTMYADRAISPWLFQWESQNATSESSSAGQRYIHHRARRSAVHLFFRDSKEADGDLGAPAYLYAGPASYVSHSGNRPMRIVWKLHHELPADIFHAASVATG